MARLLLPAFSSFYGGFVARPSIGGKSYRLWHKPALMTRFHEHCNIGYESERRTLVERCDLNPFIISNEKVAILPMTHGSMRALQIKKRGRFRLWLRCDGPSGNENLFKRSSSGDDKPVNFVAQRGTADSAICTVEATYHYNLQEPPCVINPFDSLCGGSYTQNRRNACSMTLLPHDARAMCITICG